MAISLADAARALELDPAVLRRWLRREGVALLDHPTDHRRRMISREDFERLMRERENTLAPAPSEAAGNAEHSLGGQLDALRSALEKGNDATNSHLANLLYSVAELQRRIDRLEERLSEEEESTESAESTRLPQ